MNDTNYMLRAWMGANKVSGRELAERLEMPYPTFRKKLIGASDWKLPEVYALLKITNMSFEELF